MKNLSKILATLLIASSIMPTAFAGYEYEEKVDTATWVSVSGVENGKILFDSATGKVKDAEDTITKFHLPSEINSVQVIGLSNGLFRDSTALTSVSIPGTIEEIPFDAFAHCKNLSTVIIGEGVEEISVSAFYNSKSLSTLSLPSSLEDIGDTSFGLTGLENVIIPQGVDEIGDMAFYGSSNMKSITIPASVTEIGENIVWQNYRLTDVYYGGTAEMWSKIEIDAENGQLLKATLHNSLGDEFTSEITEDSQTGWISVDGIIGGKILFDSDNGKILDAEEGITQAHIPSTINGVTVKYIPSSLFKESDELESVIVPGTIEKIPLFAFANCDNLESIIIQEGVKEISTSAFYGAEDLETLSLPSSLKIIGETSFGLSGLETLVIPEGITEIHNMAFYGSDDIETISLPSTLTKIGPKVFWQCSDLEVVNYNGTSNMWNNIAIDSNNKELLKAAIKLSNGETTQTNPSDLIGTPSDWADDEIKKADKVGLIIIMTDAPKFTDDITREQFAEIIVNMVELSTGKEIVPKVNPFTDTNNEDVVKAYSIGVITGTSETTFNPDGKTNREQIATMLYRAAMYIADNGGAQILSIPSDDIDDFDDGDEVSDWAKDAVTALSANGIMEGTSNSTLSPQSGATVEQSILLIYRMFEIS